MTELESFIKEENSQSKITNNILVINDSDYKSSRQTNLNFSTNYLNFKEELKLMIFKNSTIYSRNLKTISFIFLTPILFLFILQILQNLSIMFNKKSINKERPIQYIEKVDLKCSQNKMAKFDTGCISLGIAVIVNI